MVSVSVAGTAHASVRAERGIVHVEVHVEGDDRDHVVDRATGLHGRLAAEAAMHVGSGAATSWSAAQVTATTDTRYHDDSQTVVQVATAGLTVDFADFAVLGAWVAKVGQEPDARVEGIDWELTEETRAEVLRDLRRAAVEDAVLRAATYAAAAGAGRPRLTALAEPAASRRGDGPTPAFARAMSAIGSSAGFALRPADIEVTCAVLADFDA